MSKGSKDRTTNNDNYKNNYDDIFRKDKKSEGDIKLNWLEKLGSQIDRLKGMKK